MPRSPLPPKTPPPAESPRTVGIGCLIVLAMFAVVGAIMHSTADLTPSTQPAAVAPPTAPPVAPSLPPERAAIRQFTFEEGENIQRVNGDISTMQRLMDPPEFGNALWLSNVKDVCKNMEIDTERGKEIDTPPSCHAVQRAYARYLNDIGYYGHWMPRAIESLQASGSTAGINDCTRHMGRAAGELKKAIEKGEGLKAHLDAGN